MTVEISNEQFSILYNPDRTAHAVHSGLPDWKEANSPVTEPVFSAEDKQLIDQLKAAVLAHLNDPNNQSIKSLRHPDHDQKDPIFDSIHWRDIYHAHSHKTTIKPSTHDPRLQSNYQSTYQSLGPNCADWPDYRYHQFLVARKRHVKKAAIMLLDYVSWYVNFGVADLLNQSVCPFSDAVEQFYPERFHGVDLKGQPLLIGCAGCINVDAYLARALPLEAAYLTQTYKLETCQRACIEASHLSGTRHVQFTNIQDLAHFTYGHRVGIPWVKKCALIASNFYPESLAISIVPNMPSWFSMLWAILSTFLDERTQSKVDFPGSNWTLKLTEYVAVDQLPREWSGSCTKCNSSNNQTIHQSNNQSNQKSLADGCLPYCVKYDRQALIDEQNKQVMQLESDQTSQTITLGARQSENLTFPITADMCDINVDGSKVTQFTLWWSIQLPKDVDVSISWKQNGQNDEVNIVESKRVTNEHRGCHTFTVATEHDLGCATIRLSNQFSMFSSKQLSIKAGLTNIA